MIAFQEDNKKWVKHETEKTGVQRKKRMKNTELENTGGTEVVIPYIQYIHTY